MSFPIKPVPNHLIASALILSGMKPERLHKYIDDKVTNILLEFLNGLDTEDGRRDAKNASYDFLLDLKDRKAFNHFTYNQMFNPNSKVLTGRVMYQPNNASFDDRIILLIKIPCHSKNKSTVIAESMISDRYAAFDRAMEIV